MYALLEGDIGYQATGSAPNRPSQSGYAKLASKKENLWSSGSLTSDDLAGVINPDSGYLVGSKVPAQEARIVELLDKLVETKKPISVRDI